MRRLRTIWHLLNLPCEGIARLISESLDRELGWWERAALRSHVVYCSACRRYRRQLEQLRRAMRQLADRLASGVPAPDSRLPDEARERIKRALRQE